jgi:DNA-directed RNA polymerase
VLRAAQIANSWGKGVDKLSFPERRHFAQRNLHHIIDSADRPLDPHASRCLCLGRSRRGHGSTWAARSHMRGMRRWWQGAEAPWQALAACMEVRNALAWGDVAAFPSRLPVQVDGSCNGLQHYAALSRDARGAAAVNLTPVPRPQVGLLLR